jgi:hypothetical protein
MMMETACEDAVNSLSVRELKRVLHNNSVTTNGVVEKADLVARVREALHRAKSGKKYESASVVEDRCARDEELARRLQREEDMRTRLIQEEEARYDRQNSRGIFGHIGRALGGASRIFGGVLGGRQAQGQGPPTDEDSDMARRMQEEEWAASAPPRGRQQDGARRGRGRPRGSQRQRTANSTARASSHRHHHETSSQQESDIFDRDEIMIHSSSSDGAYEHTSDSEGVHAYTNENGHMDQSPAHGDDESGQGEDCVCVCVCVSLLIIKS